MYTRVATHGIAVLLFLLPPIFGGPVAAFAQYQVNVSAIEPAQSPGAAPDAAEPFGAEVRPVASGGVIEKWNGVVADIRADDEVLARCRTAQPCPPAAQKFLAIIAIGRAHDGRARIGLINRAINLAIRPMSDIAQWGVEDRWSAPLATLSTGRGDCEDYAIAKYVALRQAGVGEDDLRLVIVRDLTVGEDHAVVTARVDDKWIVLDNRRLTLLEDVDMPHVAPLFVLERDGVKRFAPSAVAQAHGEGASAAPSALAPQTAPE
jgi:predicted transglutaminase-like cysteine proteinase